MKKSLLTTSIALAIIALGAEANVGMENIAYSAKSAGRGGTAIGYGDDTGVMNTNPALLGNVEGGRVDANLEMMFPEFGFRNPVNDTGGNDPIYAIPSMGVAWKQSDRMTLGVAMFNEGGTGTDYGVLNVDNTLVGGTGTYGIEYYSNFGYMVVTPTLAYRVADGLSLGVSPQFGYAMMRMKMPFANPTMQRFGAADLEGDDTNVRVKLGLSFAQDNWGVGLAYASKTDIDLKGDVTITTPTGDMGGGMPAQSIMRGNSLVKMGWPSSVKVGGFFDMTHMGFPRITLDVERIKWSEYFKAVPVSFTGVTFNGLPMPDQSFNMDLGWDDQTAYKLGFELPVGSMTTLRAGWVHGKNPVPENGILAIMNPIVEDHVTFGLGLAPNKSFEFNAAVVRGLKNTVNGATPHAISPDMQNSETDMAFWSMAMQVSYKW